MKICDVTLTHVFAFKLLLNELKMCSFSQPFRGT